MKRTVSILLVVLMVMSGITSTVWADDFVEEVFTEEGYTSEDAAQDSFDEVSFDEGTPLEDTQPDVDGEEVLIEPSFLTFQIRKDRIFL